MTKYISFTLAALTVLGTWGAISPAYAACDCNTALFQAHIEHDLSSGTRVCSYVTCEFDKVCYEGVIEYIASMGPVAYEQFLADLTTSSADHIAWSVGDGTITKTRVECPGILNKKTSRLLGSKY
ncbi:MAG: hypothetical protein AB7F82_02505 [Alphaproteobacteria bacterium]